MQLWIIAGKEMRDSLRRGWFALSVIGFALLTAGVAFLTGSSSVGGAGVFDRAAAGMVNLALLVIPLLGLTAGALSLAAERERSTLAYLMAQPVSAAEVYFGKYTGQAAALLIAVLAGLGLGGLLLAGGPVSGLALAALTLLTALLALVSVGIGCLISVMSGRSAAALGGALALWLVLVFLGDLGLMATAAAARLGIRTLFAVSLLNPLHLFRVASVSLLQPSLEVLGPVGVYAGSKLGGALMPLFLVLLSLWAVIPLGIGYRIFSQQDH